MYAEKQILLLVLTTHLYILPSTYLPAGSADDTRSTVQEQNLIPENCRSRREGVDV